MAPLASPTPTPRRRRRGTIFAGLAVFIVVVTVAAVLVARAVTTVPGHPWHDALSFFSVTVTDDWKVTGGIGAGGTGGEGESYMFVDVKQFTLPSASLSIQVSYANIPAALCFRGPGYAGLPATVDGWTTTISVGSGSNIYGTGWGLTFNSADASFQIWATTPTPDTASQAQSLIDSLKTSTRGPC